MKYLLAAAVLSIIVSCGGPFPTSGTAFACSDQHLKELIRLEREAARERERDRRNQASRRYLNNFPK